MMKLIMLYCLLFTYGCSYSGAGDVQKEYSRVSIKHGGEVFFSSLSQVFSRSFYTVKKDDLYARIVFNKNKKSMGLLVFIVGKIDSKGIIILSKTSAYHLDFRFHPGVSRYRMSINNIRVEKNNDNYSMSATLSNSGVSNGKKNVKTIELQEVLLSKANTLSQMKKMDGKWVTKRLKEDFPEY